MAKKAARRKNSMAENLLMGGIAVMAVAIIVSLFSYFRPFTLGDIKDSASAIIRDIQERQKERKERLAAKGQEKTKEEEDTIPHILLTADLGNTSDFTAEPVFPDQEDSIYSCFLDTALGAMLYYNQGDLRWKSYLYGGSDPMSRYGCGPTCVAMLINSFTPESVTPVEMADWAAQNGQFARSGGSYHSLIPDSLSAFGLHVESVAERTADNAAGLLQSGHVLVALMGKGSLTNNGHFIIIAKLKENGNVYIADPANYENSTKEWNLQQLMDELKQVYDNGAPLWAVSVN